MEFLKYLPEIKIASSSHRAPNVASVGVADIACGPSAPDDSLMSTDQVNYLLPVGSTTKAIHCRPLVFVCDAAILPQTQSKLIGDRSRCTPLLALPAPLFLYFRMRETMSLSHLELSIHDASCSKSSNLEGCPELDSRPRETATTSKPRRVTMRRSVAKSPQDSRISHAG